MATRVTATGRPPATGDVPIVRTKLIPPRLPARSVALDRHAAWLPTIRSHALCIVRAPSGYGKSTMCTGWYHALKREGVAVAWVSFDREDDDPSFAIRYILAAATNAGVEDVPAWDGLSPATSLAAALVNAIDRFERDFALFLDDVDRLTDPRVAQFLAFVLLHRPANLHLVAACQRLPALPLTRLTALGELVELGQDTLQLRDDEAVMLLEADPGVRDAADIRRLNTAMAGWVTGLRIGSAALRNNSEALLDIGVPSQAMHWLDDYLDENIFQHLPVPTRQFLMRCAIVERLEPGLCAALTGETNADTLLNWLADQNLFIQRLDDASTAFRVHPVFRRFLLARLKAEEAHDANQLHVRASRWLASHDRTSEAIDHAIAAGELALAAEQIDAAAMKTVERSDILTLLDWIGRLPADIVEAHPRLRLGQAWSLTLALRGTARGVIDRLRHDARAQNDEVLRREIDGIEAIFFAVYEDRFDEVAIAGHAFLDAPHDEGSFVSRAVRNALGFAAIVRGRSDRVHDIVRPAQICAMRSEQLFTTAYRNVIIGMAYRAQGELREAERVFATALAQADLDGGRQSASSSVIAPFLARSLYERGDVESATAALRNRLNVIDEAAFHEAVIDAYVVSCRVAALRGGPGEAVSVIDRAEMIGHERGWRRLLATCLFERARLGLPFTTDPAGLAPANALSDGFDPLALDTRTRAVVLRALAMSAIRQGHPATAELDAVARYAAVTADAGLALELRLLRLLGDDDRGGDDAAHRDWLAAAVARGFGRSIVDIVVAIDESWLDALCLPDPRLQPLFAMRYDRARAVRAEPADTSLFALLTAREIDVLGAVARGDSNKEIARRLHLTPETVKWHLKNLMRKLEVDNRTAAVDRASLLGFAL